MLASTKLAELTTQQKRELLIGLLRGGAPLESLSPPVRAITPDVAARHEPFPLTDVQRAYWLGRGPAFELGNVSCHMYFEFDIEQLDRERLAYAWRSLIARHDMLRAVVDGDGRQRVLKDVPDYDIEHFDLRNLDSEAALGQLHALRFRMSHQVLPSDSWPLFELCTSQVSDTVTRVHVSFDLLIIDLWSVQILIREWFQLYLDPDSRLELLQITYRDYVMATVTGADPERARQAEKYWQERLSALPSAPDLPLAKSPGSVTYPHFVRRQATLAADAWQSIRRKAKSVGLTPSAVLIGAFSDVLAAWSRVPCFTINVTVFQRLELHPQVNEVVGDFTSINLLAVDRRPRDAFEAACHRIQMQLWKDLEHAAYSGVRVIRDLARKCAIGPGALMPVVFTSALVLDTSAETKPTAMLAPTTAFAVTQTPQVWLDHQVYEQAGQLHFSWDVVEELFPPGLIDEMFSIYSARLEDLAKNPMTWLQPSPCLTPKSQLADRSRVNTTYATVPAGLLHEPFLEQARKRPEHLAIIADDRSLTYGELRALAHRWAVRLRECGARPNRLIGVVLDKGWEQVVAVLAVLEAGAAYLPVDPRLPARRRAHLLQNGEVQLVLTHSRLDAALDWPPEVTRLHVDLTPSSSDGPPLTPAQSANDLAYVIFTSGSTGLPKGVMIDHRGALNTVADVNDRFGVCAADRVLSVSSLSFDLSVWDIFGSLAAGATVVLPASDNDRDPAAWVTLIGSERITIWNSVPALLELAIEYAAQRNGLGDSLRLALLSGDWIPVNLPNRLRALVPRAVVVSLGGATEASIWSVVYPIGDVPRSWKSIPYGHPMRYQCLHVLDEALQPRPVWVPGDLYIGGIGLAKGYWRDEVRTSEQFLVHPASGDRLYRTGDVGRYLPDSTIEFLGRQDLQVKVHGYRIELGEIETTLERHPAVRSAVASVSGGRTGPKRLVAYVVASEAALEGVQAYLREQLPEYMVPSIWQTLAAMPLTPNGKVDRAALPMPAALEVSELRALPENELEAALTQLWAGVLGTAVVGVEDNFFALGGDSLAAVQILTQIREQLGVELAARTLFENPTVRRLARAMSAVRRAALPVLAPVVALVPDPARTSEPFPLTDLQQAYWIGRTGALELGNVAAHLYFEVDGVDVDVARLGRAWQQLIARHGMLRAIIRADGSQQMLADVPTYEIVVDDVSGMTAEEAARRLEATRDRLAHQVLATDVWPMFELQLTRLPGGHQRLHVSFDLLIVDVRSVGLLLSEWFVLYKRSDVELPPLEISFRDYVLGVQALTQSTEFRTSLDYWIDRLSHLPQGPDLPLARQPASIARPRFRRRGHRLAAEPWRRFKAAAGARGLTPSAAIMTAFADVLALWSSVPHFTLNLTLFQRLPVHPQVGRLVGDFTSVTLLEIDLRERVPFTERALRLQQRLWQDLEHRYVSGVRILRELGRRQAAPQRVFMPVVFTSTLGQEIPAGDIPDIESLGELGYVITQTPQVWLDHQVSEQHGELVFSWDTVDDLFPAHLLDDMFIAYCGHLRQLAQSDEAWTRVECELTPSTHLARRARVNATATAVEPISLVSLFATAAVRRPEAPAVIHPSGVLTYEDLARRAAAVSAALLAQPASPHRLVAVVMDKGWEQVVAVLGVLGAGAAYVPIDATLPRERIHYLLANADVKSLLTQSWVDARSAWPAGISCIRVDELDPARSTPATWPAGLMPTDLAYVIYTSGSTGSPKGVMINHRGAVNTILDINRRFCVDARDRVLALSSLGFDLSVYDVFGILAAGGAIVIPDPSTQSDPERWLQLCTTHEVTIWNTVPALMTLAVTHAAEHDTKFPTSLRLVMLSGDWIPVRLPEQIRRFATGARVVSLGGATEASIWSIIHPVGEVDPAWQSIPYGVPLANQRWHVLDCGLEPRPDWVPGELYIAGEGLALGYWRDADKTAAKFIVHPRTGERLYSTGDLGRYRPDGTIEFLGREDLQVKVHGYRIELGEIEAALETYEAVQSAVVTVAGAERERTGLVAHLVVDPAYQTLLFEEVDERQPADETIWRRVNASARRAAAVPKELAGAGELLTALDRVAVGYMQRALRELDVQSVDGMTAHELLHAARIAPRYGKLIGQWLDVLSLAEDISVEAEWAALEVRNDLTPEVLRLLGYVRTSGESLARLLRGAAEPLELLFPDGSWELAESLYELNRAARYGNAIVREAGGALGRARARLRILEVGAGTGGATSALLPALAAEGTAYTYTDVSPFFLTQARRKFAAYPFVEYALFDIDRTPREQGREAASFDLVVAANVLHDARDLPRALRGLRELLAPHGMLFLLEGTRNVPLQMMTVGLLEGFSRYDEAARSRPLLSVESWRTALTTAGFIEVTAYPEPALQPVMLHALLARNSPVRRFFCPRALIGHLKEKLPAYMVPATFELLDALPLSANGKVDRQVLAAAHQRHPISRSPWVAARNPIEQQLADLWREALHVERVGIHDNFFDLGGDSLVAISLLARAREVGIHLEPQVLFERQTIAELAPLVVHQNVTRGEGETPLVVMQSEGDGVPLVFVHPSTGDIQCYAEIARIMGSDRPVYGLQWQSVDSDEPVRIEDVGRRYVEALVAERPTGTWAIAGWSSGGVIALEMARRLAARRSTVELLALLDIGPEDHRRFVISADAAFLRDMAAELGVGAAALERVVDADIGDESVADYVAVSKLNVGAMQRYTPGPYAGRTVLFRAAERPMSVDAAPDLGWSRLLREEVDVEVVGGNHFTMLRPPHAATLARQLACRLTGRPAGV